MSHTVRMHDAKLDVESTKAALRTALFSEWKVEERGKTQFYDRVPREGILAKPPAWKFPICVQDDGYVVYDNMSGSWGQSKDLAMLVASSLATESGFAVDGCTIEDTADELVMVFTG